MAMPRLDTSTLTQRTASPLRFRATASGQSVTLLPVARTDHQHYTVYWLTGRPPVPPPAFAAWYRFDETSGTTAADATGNGKAATLAGGAPWTTAGRTGGAVALDGTDGLHVADDLLAGALACSVATWVRLDGSRTPGRGSSTSVRA